MPTPTTLTKSRFRLALDCPTKVYYSLHSDSYVNRKQDDELMQALADGGHQVGALAKAMYRAEDPAAVEITTTSTEAQVRETAELLKRDAVTIFEATVRHENLLIRADVLKKRGTTVDLIEVKAKSWNPKKDSLTGKTSRSNPLTPAWEPYVYDVAFQHRVLSLAYPGLTIRPYLLVVDTSIVNTVEDLGLKFPIIGAGRGRTVAVAPDFDVRGVAEPLLIPIDASKAVAIAQTQIRERQNKADVHFDSLVDQIAGAIRRNERLGPYVGGACKSCEFYAAPTERSATRRSGWAECMETHFRQAVNDGREASVFGLYGKSDVARYVANGRLWLRELERDDLDVEADPDKISGRQRHELQWQEVKFGDAEPFLNRGPLRAAMSAWRFPLHFVDFETIRPALPFHAGQRPYQNILFQFSHHVVERDGSVRHATECLITDGRDSPSIAVATCLMDAIGGDDGTVLHWYPHERTVLAEIYRELSLATDPSLQRLRDFLESLGLNKDDRKRLFDMGRLLQDQVFLPGTQGSSSMKKVLPATFRLSTFVQERYVGSVYGTSAMPSHNFRDQTWVVRRDDIPLDPYQLLSPLFQEREINEALEMLEQGEGEVVANGAKAMLAYAMLQQGARPEHERNDLRQQLLRYCELDTLAMVMVYQALSAWLSE